MFLICYMTSLDHVIRELCELRGRLLYHKLPPSEIWSINLTEEKIFRFFNMSRDLRETSD